MTASLTTTPRRSARVHRIEVRPLKGQPDPAGSAVLDEAKRICPTILEISTTKIFLIEAALDPSELECIGTELLTDSVNQSHAIGATHPQSNQTTIEVHYKPGVMDPVAESTRQAIVEMLPHLEIDDIQVCTAQRYDLISEDLDSKTIDKLARACLANPVIHDIHLTPYSPPAFRHTSKYEANVSQISLCDLDNHGLTKLSRQAHLFLSLDEMLAIQKHYRSIGREPTDIELETLAQTWSEHCVHKTFKATVHYHPDSNDKSITGLGPDQIADRPGHTLNDNGSITINNLLKSTVVAATKHLINNSIGEQHDFCVSVFDDNAGIIRFDDTHGIAIKVETHNHPSAIEPYGGAATGIGGCIRDILGTGLAAKPIANTDTFAVAPPQVTKLPKGVIAPKRILEQVVAGVRDYGNRIGIPTVNGAVVFDDEYLGNPLVFAGCIGLIPVQFAFGNPKVADRIVILGGRTGRDGIHGATFSSSELTDTHEEEFAHAVQIGNPITEKKTMDVILTARDHPDGPLFNAITDCGAGGFSSAIGEMGSEIGACVTLESAPLKYQGLTYTEIWISEAQERMVLAVPADKVPALRDLCHAEDVEICDLGSFGQLNDTGEPELRLSFAHQEVGRISMSLLHDGVPMPVRRAEWHKPIPHTTDTDPPDPPAINDALLALLQHPDIASKHWIVRQYDHEVQGGSVIKPLVGLNQDGPSDGAVIRPKLSSQRGIAIASGIQTTIGENASPKYADDGDSYWMALACIDEAIRNAVCVGADAKRIAILDNFCWPSCDDPQQLGSFVRAAEACYDGALNYHTPFVSGKDSLNNQFTTDCGQVITIPPTLLITAVGVVSDVRQCLTMDAKAPGNILLLVGWTTPESGGSHYVRTTGDRSGNLRIPKVDLDAHPKAALAVADLIQQGLARSAHDCSDGGLLVAAAEMAIAGRMGLQLELKTICKQMEVTIHEACFSETPGRYLLEIESNHLAQTAAVLDSHHAPHFTVGTFADHGRLIVTDHVDEPIEKLFEAWRQPLDW
ncbi:MAG: phosphoribosylformylglycinamidine synthase [Phycisphaeraceae bacterium]|nr:phosphoribosylformylglycinamidine synthase [Phycisphaeraceae bacterium]